MNTPFENVEAFVSQQMGMVQDSIDQLDRDRVTAIERGSEVSQIQQYDDVRRTRIARLNALHEVSQYINSQKRSR
jgi:hypothetical protein